MALWCIQTVAGDYFTDAEVSRVSVDGSLVLINGPDTKREHLCIGFARDQWQLVYPVQSDRQANFDFKVREKAAK